MTILSTLIWTLIAPAALSASAVAAARRVARLGGPGRWGVAAGLGLGYLAGHVGTFGRPPFPGATATDWVAWLVPASAALGAFEAARPLPSWATWGPRALLTSGLLALVLGAESEGAWAPAGAATWLGGLGAVVLASWWNLEAQAGRIPGPGWMFHLALVAAGWAAVLALSGAPGPARLGGVLASAALGALPAVGLRPGPALSRGGPAVASTILTGLGLAGGLGPGVPAASAALLALAPWAPWVDRLGPIRRRSPRTRAAARGLAVLGAVGAAVLVAEAAAPTPWEGGSGP